jgi:hypothetical protein
MTIWHPPALLAELLQGSPLSRRKRAFLREHLERLPHQPTKEELVAADLLDLQLP